MIMVSTASYGDFSGNKPAAFSGAVINGQLRKNLGSGGVVITDSLDAPGASGTSPGSAALQTIRAGGDLALFAQSDSAPANALRAIAKAVKEGRLEQSVLQEAYDRILELKDQLAAGGAISVEPVDTSDSEETTDQAQPNALPTG